VVDQFNSADAFGQLLDAAMRVSEQHTEMPGADIAAMFIALANFVGAVYPDRLEYIDRVLSSCHEVCSASWRHCMHMLCTVGNSAAPRVHAILCCSHPVYLSRRLEAAVT
jgi:hypothetical protein